MTNNSKKSVLFICTHNSARSQMAEGIFSHLYGEKYDVYSAGIDPQGVHPMAVQVMDEIGIDISNYRSKSLKEFENMKFDYVVTVCEKAAKTCPIFLGGVNYFKKSFEDPSALEGTEEERIKFFRKIRDEIKDWIENSFIVDIKSQ
ncbi:MAG: arsenate reductase ArsC [Methanobacterium sp.]